MSGFDWSGDFFPSGAVSALAERSAAGAFGQELAGGRASALVPLEPTPLVVADEAWTASRVPVDGAWQLAVRYTLRNPTRRPCTVRVALVGERCPDGNEPTPLAGQLRDVVVVQDTRLLDPLAGTPEPAWSTVISEVLVYELTIPAGASSEVTASYRIDAGAGVDFVTLRALAHTAGLWAGHGPVRWTLELPRPTFWIAGPSAFGLVGWTDARTAWGASSTVTFAADAGGADVVWVLPGRSLELSCPEGLCLGWEGGPDAEQAVAAYPPALRAAAPLHLRALYGAPGAPAVAPILPPMDGLTAHARPTNPAFDEGWLTEDERRWLALLG